MAAEPRDVATPTTEGRRALLAVGVGSTVGITGGFLVVWQIAVLAGWDTTALVLVAWIWATVGRLDAERTAEFARREDDSRTTTRALLVAASVMSLIGVLLA